MISHYQPKVPVGQFSPKRINGSAARMLMAFHAWPQKCEHQHAAYCIENLLVCEKALCKILTQEVVVAEDDANSILDFKGWIRSVQDPLLELFSAFATSREFSPEEKTVAQGVGVMCTKQSGGNTVLDKEKVGRAIDKALLAAEAKADKQRVTATYQKTLSRVKALAIPLHAVSGKDFLLPLLDFWLQSHGCRMKRKSFRMRLATAGDITRFVALNRAIHSAALGYP